MTFAESKAPEQPEEILPRPQEQLLIDALADIQLAGLRDAAVAALPVLCTSLGRAQFALAAAGRWPEVPIVCHYFDLFHAEQARQFSEPRPANLSIQCAADFPQQTFGMAALPLSSHGEAELARDCLQAACRLLVLGGSMIVSTDNPRDTWLHKEMQALFDSVTRKAFDKGVVYLARKVRDLKKIRNFNAEFAFRDRGRLIRAVTRPGVFSHREIDPGARQLLDAMEIRDGDRVLDIGCGSGVLSLAAAARAVGVHVTAVDSNARAIECTLRGAELNGLADVEAFLSAKSECRAPGGYDLVLANPPYYANFRIARLFLDWGAVALRPDGEILVVTKSPGWYHENMSTWFDRVEITPSKGYHVVRTRRL